MPGEVIAMRLVPGRIYGYGQLFRVQDPAHPERVEIVDVANESCARIVGMLRLGVPGEKLKVEPTLVSKGLA